MRRRETKCHRGAAAGSADDDDDTVVDATAVALLAADGELVVTAGADAGDYEARLVSPIVLSARKTTTQAQRAFHGLKESRQLTLDDEDTDVTVVAGLVGRALCTAAEGTTGLTLELVLELRAGEDAELVAARAGGVEPAETVELATGGIVAAAAGSDGQ